MSAPECEAPGRGDGAGAGTAQAASTASTLPDLPVPRQASLVGPLGVTSIVHEFVELGAELTDAQILAEARAMAPGHFCDAAGQAMAAARLQAGYHILSWPDGTKAIIPTPISRRQCIAAYRFARADLVNYLAARHRAGHA